MKADSRILAGAGALALCLTAGGAAGMDKTFGAPHEGMSVEEYQSLVFLDPQNTTRMDWDAVRGMDGYFLIDNQGEPTVSVVDYHAGETVRKLDMGETGNHHLWVIPGRALRLVVAALRVGHVLDHRSRHHGGGRQVPPEHGGQEGDRAAPRRLRLHPATGGGRQHPRQGARLSHDAQHRHPASDRHRRDQLSRRPRRDVHAG